MRVLAVLLAVLALANPVPAQASGPGSVLDVADLPAGLRLPGSASAVRITYRSTSFTGRSAVVTGALFVPAGTPPRGGWPVLSWAHGTVGIADACAPSSAGRSQRDVDYLKTWLANGYAIAATDYEGLGTPGVHPYMHGRSAAYAVADLVRAARSVDRSVSRHWAVAGQSQGGAAALFTGGIAPRYAPELDFRGTIATAPPTHWRKFFEIGRVADPTAPVSAYMPLVIGALAGMYPDTFDVSRYLTPRGEEILRVAESACFADVEKAVAGLKNADVRHMGAELDEELLELMRFAEIPRVRHARPVYIAQGTADFGVYPPSSEETARELRAAGSDVTFKYYEGADHSGVMAAAQSDLLRWLALRFD
ncbi:lipase family protein [Lentzea sp. NPDC051838]|uniref:lipase family protein n=1 Tax=Lentzea sp. NPDC051838 TaxID=3154849 RepID=UPI0034465413